jgi:hypothetical protein
MPISSYLHFPHKSSNKPADLNDNWTTLQTFINTTPWSDYAPLWNGTLGDGQILGRFRTYGKTCFVRIQLYFGTTTTAPGGQWTITVPFVAANISGISPVDEQVLSVKRLVSGAGSEMGFASLLGGTNTLLLNTYPNSLPVQGTAPSEYVVPYTSPVTGTDAPGSYTNVYGTYETT